MTISASGRTGRYILFVSAALTINVVDAELVRSIVHPKYRMLVAAAATVDLVVIATAIYYWLLVRPGIRARWSLAPIALAGLLHATYLFPNSAAGREILAGFCELSLAGFLTYRIRKLRRSSDRPEDLLDAIRCALAAVLPIAPVANLLATELAVFYYALFSWRAQPHVPAGAKAFSMHKRGGHADLLFTLAIASLVELVPVHLLLHHWSPVSAWVVSGLTLYGAIWLAGVARSLELRPVLAGDGYLAIRYGLLFQLKIPRSAIRDFQLVQANDTTADMIVPRRSKPDLCIRLTVPLIAELPFGLTRQIKCLALAVDDSGDFRQTLARLLETD